MNKHLPVLKGLPFRCLAALAAFAGLWGPLHAESRAVTVKISVDTAGLDLNRAADAREVYRRLYLAARTACGRGNRVGLVSPPSFPACYEQALAGAVRSVNRTQLNTVYLATHTSRDAETYGIGVPPIMAAK
jgi:UrcA family protein